MTMLPDTADLATTDQLKREVAELRADMAGLRADMADRIGSLTRTIVISMVTLWASGIALSFAVSRLGA